jgi:hypothetical protein
MIERSRFIPASIFAWLIVVMIDFLAHAVFLKPFWDQGYAALKTQQELFNYIPFGYLGYLFLLILLGWLYMRIHQSGNFRTGLIFGAKFGMLFSIFTLFSWFSVFSLPAGFIVLVSLVFLIQLTAAGGVYGYLLHLQKIKKRYGVLVLVFILGLALGILLQNILYY